MVCKPQFADELPACLTPEGTDGKLLPVGLRRSYGDTTLNAGHELVDMTALDRFIRFDVDKGMLHAEAGLSIDKLLQVIVPKGWFLPTTPGTRFVTLGGAVANDVHGKNHHRMGSVGCSVREIGLLRSDGTRHRLRPGDPLFAATIGGLGLTGIITDVMLDLAPIHSAWMEVERIGFRNIPEFFRIAAESTDEFEHTVAWIDCASTGSALGRGVFQRANWATDGRLEAHASKAGPTMPFDLPRGTLNRYSIRMFNALYYRLQLRGPRRRLEHYGPVFYPLDSIRQWNRMYGKAGLYQYQCAIPPDAAEPAVTELVKIIAESGAGSFLAVLKTFGPRQSPGLLSFPLPGATLALDFANAGESTLRLLAKLDEIVFKSGGRLYPAKDGRMPAHMFRAGYGRWTELRALKDPAISSDFWRRVAA